MVKGQPRVFISIHLVVLECVVPSFNYISQSVPKTKYFKSYYHIWPGRSPRSCEHHWSNKLSFPPPMKDPCEIWIQLAQLLLTRRCLKMLTTRTTDACTISTHMSLRLRWAKIITLFQKDNIFGMNVSLTHGPHLQNIIIWIARAFHNIFAAK